MAAAEGRRNESLHPKYEQQLKRGVLEMLVLRLLLKEEKYGYQLILELREKTEGLFDLKEGTLYPVLYRLENEALVVSRWSEPKEKEVSRKYYGITEKGMKLERELGALWKQFSGYVSKLME